MTHQQLQAYTHEQLQGTIKHPYIVFSEKKKNLLEGKTTDDNSNYKNVGYVAGKGENEDRLITVLGTAKGFDRREVLIDLNNIADPDELKTEGQKKLDTYKIIQSIEGKVYQIPNMEWEKDFFLGDLVTLESDGIYEDKRIIQAKEIYERNHTPPHKPDDKFLHFQIRQSPSMPGPEYQEAVKKRNPEGNIHLWSVPQAQGKAGGNPYQRKS